MLNLRPALSTAALFLLCSCSGGSAASELSLSAESDAPLRSEAGPRASEPRPHAGPGPICPSLPTRTSASFLFKPGLAGPGTFDVEVVADGARERCTVTLGAPTPAVRGEGVVMMGRPSQETTCKLVSLDGTYSDGSLAGVGRDGETKELSLTISEKGKQIASGTFTPDYAPDECGQRTRHQELTIAR